MVFPAITDLRVFQWGKESATASVTLTIDTQPTAGDTMTIGSKLYTFVATGTAAADGDVDVGTDLTTAQAAIVAAINGTDAINTAHPDVQASAFATNVSTISARTSGVQTTATTETFTAPTNIFSAAALAGGSSRGVAVPATSKMLVANWDAEPTDQVYHPPLLRGIIQRWKGGEIVIERGTNWNIPDTPAFYEQLPHWLSMSVHGNVTPTGADPYTWTFTRDPTGNPNIDTYTIQRRLSDGVSYIDQRAPYSLVRSITFKGAQNQPVTINVDGFSRRINNSAITGALTAPTAEALLSSSSKVYIDSTWATMGATQIQGQILNWQLTFMTGYAPLFTTDGRSDLDFTTIGLSSENTQINIRITMLVQPNNGQFAIEQAAAEAQTLRAVRIQCDGSNSRTAHFDSLVKHNLGSLFKIGEFEGQDMVEMEFVESTDGSNLFSAVVVNHVATLA